MSPTELVLTPGQTVKLRARLFDAQGRFLREDDRDVVARGAEGHRDRRHASRSRPTPVDQAGLIKATRRRAAPARRARASSRPLPWNETFDGYADGAAPPGWAIVTGSALSVATLDGQKVLQKAPLDTIFKRVRAFIGPTTWSNYTFEADVRAAERRRQMGDIGITAQRYSLVLYGNVAAAEARAVGAGDDADGHGAVRVEAGHLVSPEAARREPAERPGARARQGVAAVGEPEPAAWMIDKIDPIGNRQGAPGLFIDAQFGAYLDNFSVTPNQ